MSKIQDFWNDFLEKTHQNKDEVGFSGELQFEDNNFTGLEKLNLVLSGQKTVIFSPFEAYAINREPMPLNGEVYIVEDRNKEPRCIIEVTDVLVLPFNDVGWELARQEGEDENLEQWREKQREYMKDEADLCGFVFKDDSKVVAQIFHVIYRP